MHGAHLLGFQDLGLIVHVGARALQTMHEEIQAHRPGIEMLGYETGGGFGPPIRGWHTRADVAIATVAAGPRQRNAVEIAYGKIEATEASLSRADGSQSSSHRRLARASDLSSRTYRSLPTAT